MYVLKILCIPRVLKQVFGNECCETHNSQHNNFNLPVQCLLKITVGKYKS